MIQNNLKIILMLTLFLIIGVATLATSQYDSKTRRTPQRQVLVQNDQKSESDVKDSFLIRRSEWVAIQRYGVYSSLIIWLAFIFGLLTFFIGHFAGGRLNKLKIWISIVMASIISILSRSINIWTKNWLAHVFEEFMGFEPLTSATMADVIIYILWTLYITGVAVYLYETFTVTAKEAYPPR